MPASQPYPSTLRSPSADHTALSLEQRWEALGSHVDAVAALADLKGQPDDEPSSTFARRLADADDRSIAIARRGLEDMELLASMGLKALREVEARQQDTPAPIQAPALTLWRELYHARASVLSALEAIPA